jgi:Carboxypeptidase regulatory-like domain/TonB dependent receptor
MKSTTAIFLSLLTFTGGDLWAQANASGTLQGTVTDSSKAMIPNAEIALTSPATGLRRVEKSGADGSYRFNQLPASTYEVVVKAPGFASERFVEVEVQVAIATELNATLSAGNVSDTITVDAAAPIVDTTKTDVSLAITPTEVQSLPLNGRDFGNLAYLAPGAKPVNAYDPTKARVAVFATSGSAGRNVNVTVNGVDDKDNTVGGPVMQLPLEAVQEFNISTQRFSAANGRSEGAAISLVTKSGTNQYHGALFFFDRDTVLNANDYFSIQGGQPTAPYSRQQYGGSFGGPILKDKLFAFFTIERQREQSNTVVTQSAYTNLVLAEPLGAQPTHNIPTPYNDQRIDARLDYRISPSESFSIVHNSQSNRGLNDQAGSTNDLTAGNFTTNQLLLDSASLNSVITPSVINTFTLGYQYWNNLIDSNNKVPYVSFPSAAFGTNPNVPQQSYQAKWQFRDDFAWNKGKHSFKTGFDYVYLPKLGGFFQTPSTLNVSFFDDPSTILSNPAKYPQGFSTPGAVQSMSASSGNSYFASANAKMLGLFFQDDWKLTPRLTFNLGLRWDKDFDLTGGDTQHLNRTYLALKAVNSPYAAGQPTNDNKDFSPRFGFAYDLTGSGHHVIRGGYGIYFGQIFENIPLFAEQQEGATIFTQVLNLSSTGPGSPTASLVPGTNILLSNYRYGVDPLPVIPPASANLPAGSTGRLVNPSYRNPYNQQWNLGYTWQLTPNDVIEVEGIHSLALRESKRLNINYKDPVTGIRVYDNAFAAAGLPKLAQIIVESSIGRSRYDAFNLIYHHRFTHRLTVSTNYVRSRAVGYGGASAGFSNTAENPTNVFAKGEFGPVPSDEPNRWVFSGTYDLPWGFKVAPIIQWASGRPWNPSSGISDIGYGSGNGTWRASVLTSSPQNYTATANYSAAQILAGLANGTLTQLPFDYFRGERFFQTDLRVSKEFRFGERHRLEFICQMFDLTNRANFGTAYTTSIKSANFGKPSGFLSTSGTIVPHSFEGEMGFTYRF